MPTPACWSATSTSCERGASRWLTRRYGRIRDPRGTARAYLVQPLVPHEQHLNVVLAGAEESRARDLLEAVVENVHCCTDETVGFDAQAANWWVEDDGLGYFDVSTPLLRDHDGRELLDVSLFLSVYPLVARPVLARIAPGVMAQYHDPRTVLLDFASNLHKEGLERWRPAAARARRTGVSSVRSQPRGAPLLPPGQAAVAAHAAAAARRPRLAASCAPPAVPLPAATALPLRPPKTSQGALPMTTTHTTDLPTTNAEAFDLIASTSRPTRRPRTRPSASTSCRAGARASACGTSRAATTSTAQLGRRVQLRTPPGLRRRGADHARSPSTTWAIGCCRPRAARAAPRRWHACCREPLRYSFFTASGAEAVEVACKLARSVTGRAGFVCAEHGYHGHVGFSLAMDDPPLSDRYRPLTPGIARVPFGDVQAADRAIVSATPPP